MERIELVILYREGNEEKVRAIANKWTFSDAMMGEQAVMCNIVSEKPIPFAVGDYCVFRGETYTLNYVPSVTQKAKTGEIQDAYTYENVKFDSYQDELSRCMLLDVTPTTEDYIAAYGTNYTGSSKFTLYCGESTVNGRTLTAVCALAAKIQANLDRMYSRGTWSVLVDTETTYVSPSGGEVLMTHTDDKMLSFDNSTVIQALAEVHNAFDLNYCIRGRVIYIGFQMPDLTENDGLGQEGDDEDEDVNSFAFGYGKGYPRHGNDGKGLFKIKRIANSQQRIVTRLRAMGSTKNMPYRYYNKKYGGESNPELTQSLFPTNLQLPGTFLPEGNPTDTASATGATKWSRNNARSEFLRKVKGDTNDAYIDKNDNASNCEEGIREGNARWDGSNSDLQEIYPTIEGVKYIELREALVQDMDGKAGGNGESSASAFYPYQNQERIDKLLAVGYMDNGSMVDDANVGDGILPESGSLATGIPRPSEIELTTILFNQSGYGDFNYGNDGVYRGIERRLFSVQGVTPGNYAIAPTIGSVVYSFNIKAGYGVSAEIGFVITVRQTNLQTGETTTIAEYNSDFVAMTYNSGIGEVEIPYIPDVENTVNAKVNEIAVTAQSDITVSFTPVMRNVILQGSANSFYLEYKVGNSRVDSTVSYEPECMWIPLDDGGSVSETFHVFIQDMGFDLSATFTGDTPVVSMKSGRCVGREFEIGENIQKVAYNGKKGYMLTLKRATDSSLNTYYPSQVSPLSAGDYFVLLNIEMPDAYILAAEARLLMAATDYLSDNSQTVFTYQPYIDDIYLQRNYDNMAKQGKREKSIFWQLYAGLKFSFNGIPSNANSPLPFAQITIEKVMITMGDGLTPKVDIVLNDDIQQTTLQKLTIAVDRIYGGSMFNTGLGSLDMLNEALVKVLQTEGERFFLSKNHDDVAQGIITFLNGVAFGARQLWKIDGNGNAILNNLNAQEAIFNKLTAQEAHFFTLIIDEIRSIGGQLTISPANCRIDKVEDVGDGYKCYFKASDAERTINNQWQIGMQAVHIEFNVDEGGSQNYWRVVTDKSPEPVSIDINDSEVRCHWIVLSKSICKADSTTPQAGDDLSQLGFNEAWYKANIGNTLPVDVEDLENAIIISAYNIPFIDFEAFRDNQPIKAPLYVSYRGINSFNVGAINRVAVIAGNGNYLSAVLRLENDSTLADGRDINDLGITEGNLVRNSGFTGNFDSEEVKENDAVSADTVIFSDPLKFWEAKNVEVDSVETTTSTNEDYKANLGKSVSGSVAIINNGSLKQQIESGISVDTWYVLSFKACCPDTTETTLNVALGGVTNAVKVYNSVQRIDLPFKSTAAAGILTFQTTSKVMLMDVMLIRGNIPSEYQKSEKDNDKSLAKFLELSYLHSAITEASTEIIGGLVLTQLIKVGMFRDKQFTQETGGMSGLYIDEHSPFVYGGGTLEQAIYTAMKYSNPRYMPDDAEVAEMAKFVVTHGGRAILNDICLRGYIYALGGIFKNVQSQDGKWSLDEKGIMKCVEAWISGSIYTPYLIINDSNISQNSHPSETSGWEVTPFVIDLDKTGLNLQMDCDATGNVLPLIEMPTISKYVGGEANIYVNKPCVIVNVTTISPSRNYQLCRVTLDKGQKIKLKCIYDNGTYRWIPDSYSDLMRFRQALQIAFVYVHVDRNASPMFVEQKKSYDSNGNFTYVADPNTEGRFWVTLPSDWQNLTFASDLIVVAHSYGVNGVHVNASIITFDDTNHKFLVGVGDDASPNDGDFGFSIYLTNRTVTEVITT